MWNGDYNSVSYLYKGCWYWSFSPNYLSSTGFARVFNLNANGYIGYNWTSRSGGIAPVINLSTDAVSNLTGDGTQNNPFRIAS